MEPSAAIAVIETDLRRLVGLVLKKSLGREWLTEVLDNDTRLRLEARLLEEGKRRAPAVVPSDLLAYTHLYELRGVIEKRWEDFKPALGEKREFSVMMDKVEDFRNAPAHSRELLPYERALLDGIAGSVRTQVTRFVSQQAPDGQHYPVLEWIRDSFGNEIGDVGLPPGDAAVIDSGVRLQVGEVVRFEARAWDPQGRELTWQLAPIFAKEGPTLVGNEVAFEWAPTEENVQSHTFLEIELCSSGKYHRHGSYDQRVSWGCSVDPPVA